MNEKLDSIPDLKLALEAFARNMNKHEAFDNGYLGVIMASLPLLIEETEELRKEAQLTKGYAVVIHDPDSNTIVETQGQVEVFSVDLGASFDIGNPMEMDALEALEQAAEHARAGEGIPEGVVKDTLYGAVEQIVDVYGEFKDAVTYLSEEDRNALADWLPKVVEAGLA